MIMITKKETKTLTITKDNDNENRNDNENDNDDENNRELKQQPRRRLQKRHLKSEFAPLRTLSRLFHLV